MSEKIAIQILFNNTSRYAPMVLKSLQAQTIRDWKLFVMDNSCHPQEASTIERLLQESGIKFQFTASPRNLGFAGGHQALFEQHASPFVVLLNDDAYLDPSYLEACLARSELDPSCASVQGLVYHWSCGPDQPEPLSATTKIDTLGLSYVCLGKIVDGAAGRLATEVASEMKEAHHVFGSSGAVVLYRRDLVLQATPWGQLFDPEFFLYKEDVDLALRLKRAAFTTWFEPRAIAFHARTMKSHQPGLLARIREERRRPLRLRVMMYRNQWALYVMHARWSCGWRDLWLTCMHECLRSASLFFLGSPFAFFEAWVYILRHQSGWRERRKQL